MHRDLKPENILLEEAGDLSRIKLADFGSAAELKGGELIRGLVGAPYYVAPEVIRS